jgi:hypothetical protein
VNRFRNIFLTMIFALSAAAFSSAASDIYFGNAAAGSNNGTSCANAYAWNDGTYGWNRSAQQQPGNTLHVCGTITFAANATALTTVNSGTNGSPITLLFETGSSLQAPYFNASGGSTGGIIINNAYWVVNGGTNGFVENTQNGDSGGACPGGCSNQQGTSQILASTTSGGNLLIENLTIKNVFVKSSGVNDGGVDSVEAISLSGNNTHVTNCSLSNGWQMVSIGQPGISNVEVDHVTASNCAHCFSLTTFGTNVSISGIKFHDNHFVGGNAIYDTTDDEYHQDVIIVFLDSNVCTGCQITGLQIYNNLCDGLWSKIGQLNSCIFMDEQGSNTIPGYAIYNNVDNIQDGSYQGPSGAELISESQNSSSSPNVGSYIVNNTIYQSNADGTCMHINNTVSLTLKNNIVDNCGYEYENIGTVQTTPAFDYNVWFSSIGQGSGWIWPTNANCSTGTGCSFSGGTYTWQNSVFDTHGQYANPNVNTSTFLLPSGSSAIGAGANLTSLCSTLTALCTGAPQTFGYNGSCGTGCLSRTSTGAWDAGAYPYSSSDPPPTPPTGLSAVVN